MVVVTGAGFVGAGFAPAVVVASVVVAPMIFECSKRSLSSSLSIHKIMIILICLVSLVSSCKCKFLLFQESIFLN